MDIPPELQITDFRHLRFVDALAAALGLDREGCIKLLIGGENEAFTSVARGSYTSPKLCGKLAKLREIPMLASLATITDLDVSDNSIAALRLLSHPELQTLKANNCPHLQELDITGCELLFHLEIAGCKALRAIRCLDLQAAVVSSLASRRKTLTVKEAAPGQMDRFVRHWNWDCGDDPINWIVRQPRCDLGTAMRVYWVMEPNWFRQWVKQADAPAFAREHWTMLHEVQDRILSGFYKSRDIAFDPQRDVINGKVRNWTARNLDDHDKFRRELPLEVYQPVACGQPLSARPVPTAEQLAVAEQRRLKRELLKKQFMEKMRAKSSGSVAAESPKPDK
jgi:hypothetical protein